MRPAGTIPGMARFRVIGLGNEVITDDAVGLHVAREVGRRLPETGLDADVVESATGGFGLLDLLCGREGVVIVDALEQAELRPGQVVQLASAERATSLRLWSPHEISLPVALQVGPRLGYAMPARIEIIGVQGQELRRFGSTLTPEVAAAVPRAAGKVIDVLRALSADRGA